MYSVYIRYQRTSVWHVVQRNVCQIYMHIVHCTCLSVNLKAMYDVRVLVQCTYNVQMSAVTLMTLAVGSEYLVIAYSVYIIYTGQSSLSQRFFHT